MRAVNRKWREMAYACFLLRVVEVPRKVFSIL
jgi:hypothetical protein